MKTWKTEESDARVAQSLSIRVAAIAAALVAAIFFTVAQPHPSKQLRANSTTSACLAERTGQRGASAKDYRSGPICSHAKIPEVEFLSVGQTLPKWNQ